MRKIAAACVLASVMALAGPNVVQAQTGAVPLAENEVCISPNHARTDRINWFLGIHPSDDLLTVFCRLQDIPGAIKFNVLFPTTGAHRTWETSFDGPTLPAGRVADLIQTVLPVADGPVEDENGQPFARVLGNVVQLKSETAPDNSPLGFAPTHPAAKELVLWEPVILRIKPINLAGAEFTLNVMLKPSLGMLALALQGKATDLQFNGWKGRLPIGSFFSQSCGGYVPDCAEMGDIVAFHAPWVVDEVSLVATGDNLTSEAIAIGQQIGQSNDQFVTATNIMSGFNESTGNGQFQISDGQSRVRFNAKGSNGGTTQISIIYEETGGDYAVETALKKIASEYRISASEETKQAPAAPDSLGRL